MQYSEDRVRVTSADNTVAVQSVFTSDIRLCYVQNDLQLSPEPVIVGNIIPATACDTSL